VGVFEIVGDDEGDFQLQLLLLLPYEPIRQCHYRINVSGILILMLL